ncbi:class I SAM-dependent methyltransferase [Anaerotignum faecicola]|nr:class I SAM-dependent methyltransferase [Anaerotignum faecicola]
MELSVRLKAVADEVNGGIIADIGTDHGYVPIYLVKTGKIKKAVACDINKGPLLKARENIEREGLKDKIETRLGNGLSQIDAGEVETAVIAGMGGMLIIDILKSGACVAESLKQLVLQPQLDIESVRRHIHTIGFKIVNEKMVVDGGKFYTIINAVRGQEKYEKEIYYSFGKINIDKKCPVLREYIAYMLNRLSEIENGLKSADTENAVKKTEYIKKEIELLKEAEAAYEMQ